MEVRIDRDPSGHIKELQRYHFDEAAIDRLIIMGSRNPYLDPLAQNTSLSSLFDEHEPDGTEAVNFFGRFSSMPVPGPLVIESLQAYMSQDRQIFVSGYDGQNNIISKWKPLDAVSINYGAVGSGVNIKSLDNQLLNGALRLPDPDNERLDEVGHHR